METYKNRYTQCILITLLCVLFGSCLDNTVGNKNTTLPVPSTTMPIWPQSGYNAQNTSNPNAPKVICSAVMGGQVAWYYFFPNTYYSDGAEFCVDSKNNIYFLSQQDSTHKIYKFKPEGTIIWIKECSSADNFASISISTDEAKIYFNTSKGLNCFDSSGNCIWVSNNSGYYTKPAIGSDGTIYTKTYSDIAAINPDGSLKWTTPASLDPYSVTRIALAREDNIYTAEMRITNFKFKIN